MSLQRSLVRKSLAVVGLLTVIGLGLPGAAPAVTGARPVFEPIGELERFPADARALLGSKLVPTFDTLSQSNQRNESGTVIVLPKARLLWQLYQMGANPPMGIVVRDLDSLRIVRAASFEFPLARATPSSSGAGGWQYAVDDEEKRLFLMRGDFRFVEEFDPRTLARRSRPLPASTNPLLGRDFGFPYWPGGLTYDPFANDLLVLYGGQGSIAGSVTNTMLYRLDLDLPPAGIFSPQELAQLRPLRSCSGPLPPATGSGNGLQWQILVTRDYLYAPCQSAGLAVLVVRVPREGDAASREDVAAGPLYGESVLADPGSGRLFVTISPSGTERAVWAFDTTTMAFVGLVATGVQSGGLEIGVGLDPATGRVFFQSNLGLGVVEGRFFPVPQARTVPRLLRGQEQIWSDPITGRVFVLEGFDSEKAATYRVYRTDPAPKPPPLPDPDANTADVAEKPGVTESRFNASASGYGARVLWARGYGAVPPAPAFGPYAPTAMLLWAAKPPCGFSDREFFAGRVARTEYDTGSTAAQAVAVALDGNTALDVDQPGRCVPQLGSSGDADRWTYTPASCSSEVGSTEHRPAGEGMIDPGPASVSCPEPGGVLEARAASEAKLDDDVSVARSWTTTRVEPLAGGGVRSTATAVAEGVTIAGTLRIGEIRSTATSFSNGRPRRRAMSEHAIAVSHVTLGDTVLCEGACDLKSLEERLNAAASGRAVFRTGQGSDSPRDNVLLEGSLRGAQTGVQKSAGHQTSDRALQGDFTVEVPALQVTVFNDNMTWGRARQVYQFAGVATAATYNVVRLPTSSGDLPLLDESTSDAMEVDDLVGLAFAEDGSNGSTGSSQAASSMSTRQSGPRGWAAPFVAVARGLRLALADPRSGVLLLGVWALLGLPAVLARRRLSVGLNG